MKFILFALGYLVSFQLAYAQKPSLTDTCYKSWTHVMPDGQISPDGKHATFTIENEPRGGRSLVITATDYSWKMITTQLQSPKFSNDSKLLFAMSADTLVKLKLDGHKISPVARTTRFNTFLTGTTEWLAYNLKDSSNTLVVENLVTKKIIKIGGVQTYFFNKEIATLLLKVKNTNESIEKLRLLYLTTGKTDDFYTGNGTADYIFDKTGSKLAFSVEKNGLKEIRVYNINRRKLLEYTINLSKVGPDSVNFSTEFVWKFTSNGKRLLFTLDPRDRQEIRQSSAIVWNVNDAYLPDDYRQAKPIINKGKNLSALDLASGQTIRLLGGNLKPDLYYGVGDVIIATEKYGRSYDVPWNTSLKTSYFICFPETGRLDTLQLHVNRWLDPLQISPDNKYLIYFDNDLSGFVCYEFANKERRDISKDIKEPLAKYLMEDRGTSLLGSAGIAGWITDQGRVVIQGRFHLWSLDPSNRTLPIKLTAKCSNQDSLIFQLPNRNYRFDSNQDIMLTSVNISTKETILYNFNLKKGYCSKIFQTLDYRDDFYFYPALGFVKASNANRYLFRTHRVACSLNYLVTSDFKIFDTLSHNFPEAKYNWFTSELIKYTDKFGHNCEAVLYKPENFDPLRKYPVIMHYYISQTSRFNQYMDPEASLSGQNMAVLISNGYIVVSPNIYLEEGKPGESALNSVMAATNYISRFSWVDSTKIGLSGHSFGGFQTNYIVTHTNRFRAAVAGAGVTNIVEGVTGTWGKHRAAVDYYVTGPYRLKEFNETPNDYIKYSPIMSTSTMNTPLLLIHNEADQLVPVSHGIHFFIQLRRENKPVWLLQYPGEGHLFNNVENQLDAQRKIKSFFDHYLKGMEEPEWMTIHN